MTAFRTVTEEISVSPQIQVEDVARAAKDGFTLIVNNRPDGEEDGQPPAAQIEAAAKAASLGYVHIPVRGMPTRDQVAETAAAVAAAEGPVLLYCRSGTRSIITWSLGAVQEGVDAAELKSLAAAAGYDLSNIL
jgi:uncharacterized protein (TIGR01244 family)